MKRIGIVTSIVAMLLVAFPATAQQFQSKDEYDAYMALYNEQDPATKVELGESFVSDFPNSEAAPIAYQLLVATHYSGRDWRSLLDVAKRFDRTFPDASDDTRSFIYRRAMAAAQQEQQPLDILEFGDKLLELDRDNLGAMLTLPPVILDNIPGFGSARERNLQRAFDLANRARVRAQQAYPIVGADAQQNAERVQVFSRIHLYLGQVHELRGDDQRAAADYARILDYDRRNSDAYLRLGLAYQRQAAALSEELAASIEAHAADPAAEPPAEPVEAANPDEARQLDPESEALQQAVLENLELAIDYLASASALGGQAATLAQRELNAIYDTRDPESWELSCESRPDGYICRLGAADSTVTDLNRIVTEKRADLTRTP